jgi:hypothetical protein
MDTYMATALEGSPEEPLRRPSGIVAVRPYDPAHPSSGSQEFFYVENVPPPRALSSAVPVIAEPTVEERD